MEETLNGDASKRRCRRIRANPIPIRPRLKSCGSRSGKMLFFIHLANLWTNALQNRTVERKSCSSSFNCVRQRGGSGKRVDICPPEND